MSETKANVGGQAVLEGVMMRSPKCFAVAVRRKSGEIVIREQPWKAAWTNAVAKVPFVRGAVTLFESLQNGYSALRFSAEQMEQDLEEEEAAKAPPSRATAGRDAGAGDRLVNNAGGSRASEIGSRLGIVLAIGFFIALPQLLAWLVGRFVGPGFGLQSFWFHAVTGGFKLALVIGYLMLIRRVPEVRRVFQYHGAEHKAIATYEAGQPLTVEYAKQHSTRHARCGTTFLIVVVMVSVLVYAGLLPPILRGIEGGQAQLLAIGIKILMLPLIAGVAYELQRLGARFTSHPLARLLLTPGYWVQGITTIEPTDDQLEIALASLRVTLKREAEVQMGASAPVEDTVVRSFPSYAQFALAYAVPGPYRT